MIRNLDHRLYPADRRFAAAGGMVHRPAPEAEDSYFNALIYIRSESLQPLQIVLRSILVGNQTMSAMSTGAAAVEAKQMADLIKYAIIVVSSAPIMCMYPLVQKYFNQGVMLGSLKG